MASVTNRDVGGSNDGLDATVGRREAKSQIPLPSQASHRRQGKAYTDTTGSTRLQLLITPPSQSQEKKSVCGPPFCQRYNSRRLFATLLPPTA